MSESNYRGLVPGRTLIGRYGHANTTFDDILQWLRCCCSLNQTNSQLKTLSGLLLVVSWKIKPSSLNPFSFTLPLPLKPPPPPTRLSQLCWTAKLNSPAKPKFEINLLVSSSWSSWLSPLYHKYLRIYKLGWKVQCCGCARIVVSPSRSIHLDRIARSSTARGVVCYSRLAEPPLPQLLPSPHQLLTPSYPPHWCAVVLTTCGPFTVVIQALLYISSDPDHKSSRAASFNYLSRHYLQAPSFPWLQPRIIPTLCSFTHIYLLFVAPE